MLNLLKNRLANIKLPENLSKNELYDVIYEKGKISCSENDEMKNIKIEGEEISGNGSIVYQQVSFEGSEDGFLKFRKNKYSSQSKRIHPIYEQIL